jgi:ABC-type transport system involved in cytochrome c biogenesis permease subunit
MTPPDWLLAAYELLIWTALVLSLVGLVLRSLTVAHRCGMVLTALVLAVWLLRFWKARHLPMFGAYESALSLACFAGIVMLIYSFRQRQSNPFLFIYPPAVFLLLLHGSRYSAEIWALTISERGFWVHLHAIAAFAAFGVALCLAAASVLVLINRQLQLHGLLLNFMLLYTLTIVSGSFYRFLLFGDAWSFDPMESMNLACFLAFTTLLHLTISRQWPARKTAGWSLFCLLLLVLAYRLILVFPAWSSYHILDIDLRSHIIPG